MLETAVQLESDPPETVTSDSTKSVEASERVKVSVDVSPALKESSASSSVMVMVGAVASVIVMETDCHVLTLPQSIDRSLAVEPVLPRVAITSTS